MGFLSSIVGLGSKLLGSFSPTAAIGLATQAGGALFQNYSAQQAAQTQMDFQKSMYGTRYQMQMADMRKAGLNPMLSYMQGPPGAPGGSTYTPQNVGAAGLTGAQTAVTAATSGKKINWANRLAQANVILAESQGASARAQANLLMQNRSNEKVKEGILVDKAIQEKTATSSAVNLKRYYDSEIGRYLQYLDKGGRSINPFIKAR